jgi:hypothetical protein
LLAEFETAGDIGGDLLCGHGGKTEEIDTEYHKRPVVTKTNSIG